MLNPKPRAERHSQSDDAPHDLERRGHPERRSFAPRDEALRSDVSLPGRDSVLASARVLPGAWTNLDPARLIDLAAANAPEPLTEEQLKRRALVVIPCLNEEPLIAGVIARILQDERLVDPLVLVADGGSTDRSREIVAEIAARDPRVRLMPNPDRLQSAGVNRAADLGDDRPWLVRIDAHADYPKDYVSTLIEEARRTGAHSVVVAMDTVGEDAFQRAVAAAQNSRLGTGGAAHRVGAEAGFVDHGHHALFNREAFRMVGGYDESFSHNEDAELDLRLTREGAKIWLTDRTRIVYHPRKTPGALWKQYLSYGKGRCRTVLKHHTPLKLRQALPLAVAPAVLGLASAPLFWALAIPALVWMLTALTYGALLAAKARDPAVLMSGPAAMIMHLAWSLGFWLQLASWIRQGGGERARKPRLAPASATP